MNKPEKISIERPHPHGAATFTVIGKDFCADLQPLLKVARGRKPIPILNCVRLRYAGGRLEAAAYDGDDAIEAHPHVLRGAGQCDLCVHAAQLSRAVKSAGNGTVTFCVSGEEMRIEGDVITHTFDDLFDAEDFPAAETRTFAAFVSLRASDLSVLFKNLLKFISRDPLRYNLMGAHIACDDDGAFVEATDGHRLLRERLGPPTHGALDVFGGEGMRVGWIMSKNFIEHAIALLKLEPPGRRVALDFSGNRVRIETEYHSVQSKTLDGTYPDTRAVTPDIFDVSPVVVNRMDLLRSVRAIKEKSESLKAIALALEEGFLVGSRKANQRAPGVKFAVPVVGDEWPRLGVNSNYLAELLGCMEGRTVKIWAKDRYLPITFGDETERLALLMTMRL